MKMLRWFASFLPMVVGMACSADLTTSPITQPAYDVVFAIPGGNSAWELTSSPDGTLFLASETGLYRALPSNYAQWQRLTEGPFRAHDLYSPTGATLFGVVGNNAVYRWTVDNGLEAMTTPVSDSLVVDHDWMYGIALNAIWGTSETNVYAAGWGATVLHFDGFRWRSMPNPMHAMVDSGGPAMYAARLRALAGTGGDLYATASNILARRGGRWSQIARPDTGYYSRFCGFNTAAVYEGHLYVAGGQQPCLLRLNADDEWEVLTHLIAGFSRPGPFGGGTQADGSALFWASSHGKGDVLRLHKGRAQIYQFPSLAWFGGATVANGSLFATGWRADTLFVVSVPLEAP